ncbi:hypothetical protein [Protaetiibacter larvae]|uniref:Uncharacterized protein n=1 Tax=Protaetiibacter larvae TaxID=2592654 RepID=A0A5C1Y5X1_9MICO|nr:hypothetical protein [Protaetiibacter larvae]QEO09186.1 hypothetical protein FLP23_03655 [Protaetiibacter larvae]
MARRAGVRAAAAALAAVVAASALSGCQFVEDVVAGQRLLTAGLNADAALRELVAELEALVSVESAEYAFDAADVDSRPGLQVALVSTDPGDWREVQSLIEETGELDAFEERPITATLTSGMVSATIDTGSHLLLGADALAAAREAGGLFPDARIELAPWSDVAAAVTVSTPGTAEELLARVTGDPGVRAFLAPLDPERVWVAFRAAGLELGGIPSAAEAQWILDRLAVELPRYPVAVGADAAVAYPTEWVQVSAGVSAADRMFTIQLVGDDGVATGPAWDALLEVLRVGAPGADDSCAPLQVFYPWPGVQGNWPSFVNDCVEWADANAVDRPTLAPLRDALAASGIDLAALGFRLS